MMRPINLCINIFKIRWLQAFLIGLLLACAFLPIANAWWALVAVSALILFLDQQPCDIKHALIFSMAFYVPSIYWVYHSVKPFVYHPAFALLAVLLLALYMSLYKIPALMLSSRRFNIIHRSCLFAVLWIVGEYASSHILGGFPWVLLQVSMLDGPLAWLFLHVNTWVVSVCALMVAACMAFSIQRRSITLLFVILSALYMMPMLKPIGMPSAIPRVMMFQSNLDIKEKFSAPLMAKYFSNLVRQSMQQHHALLVWPEAAIPGVINGHDPWIKSFSEHLKKHRLSLISGALVNEGSKPGIKNVALFFSGDVLALSDKRHYVPFGEYMPYRGVLARMASWFAVPMVSMDRSSHTNTMFNSPWGKIKAVICYDVLFADTFADHHKPDWYVVINDDRWFLSEMASSYHLAAARLRAIVSNRPIIFVSNGGYSALIDAHGYLVFKSKRDQARIYDFHDGIVEDKVL